MRYQARADQEWSEENIEFAIEAVDRASSMRLLRIIKETDMDIIPVIKAEGAVAKAEGGNMDNIEADCEEREDGRRKVFDVGGGLTRFKAEVERAAGNQGRYYRFQGPFDLEKDLGDGVKIRLCNRNFADKATLEY